jgi:indolepyruvate ferredoxin oxidoreductase
VRIVHHLAPPLIGRTDASGQPVKSAFGPWMHRAMPWLAKLKFLRGTAFDPFGRTEERRTERALITEYRATVEQLIAGLTADRLALAVEIAQLPDGIRGYGHVKAKNLAAVRERWNAALLRWRDPSSGSTAAPAGQSQRA